MIINGSKQLRVPSVLDEKEYENLSLWVASKIEERLLKGYKSFTIIDLFGDNSWNWSRNKFPIQIVYNRWFDKYQKENPNLDYDTLSLKAFKAAGVSVGYLIKKACNDSKRSFRMVSEFNACTRYILY